MTHPLRRRAYVLVGALSLSLGLGALAPAPASADEPTNAAALATPLTVTGLKTNARVDPIGIPGAAPRLSWHSTSPGRGAVQSAYQVRVAAGDVAAQAMDVSAPAGTRGRHALVFVVEASDGSASERVDSTFLGPP